MKTYLQAGKQYTQRCYQDCLSALEYKLEVMWMIKFNMLSILESFMIIKSVYSICHYTNNTNRLQIDDSNIHLSAHAQINIRLQRI